MKYYWGTWISRNTVEMFLSGYFLQFFVVFVINLCCLERELFRTLLNSQIDNQDWSNYLAISELQNLSTRNIEIKRKSDLSIPQVQWEKGII